MGLGGFLLLASISNSTADLEYWWPDGGGAFEAFPFIILFILQVTYLHLNDEYLCYDWIFLFDNLQSWSVVVKLFILIHYHFNHFNRIKISSNWLTKKSQIVRTDLLIV